MGPVVVVGVVHVDAPEECASQVGQVAFEGRVDGRVYLLRATQVLDLSWVLLSLRALLSICNRRLAAAARGCGTPDALVADVVVVVESVRPHQLLFRNYCATGKGNFYC